MSAKRKLHMQTPIWVWLYDFGSISHPEMWIHSENKKLVHPQAHTYCFFSEEEARAHPEQVGWPKDHQFVLCKTWLQTPIEEKLE